MHKKPFSPLSPDPRLQIWVMIEVHCPIKILPSGVWVYPSLHEPEEEGTVASAENRPQIQAAFRNEKGQAEESKH